MALGVDLNVQTLEGPQRIRIPAGTQSGDVVELSGKGIFDLRERRKGDHKIHVRVVTPRRLSKDAKQHLNALDKELGDYTKDVDKKGFLQRIFDAI